MTTQTIDPAPTTSNPARRPGESPRQQSVCVEIPVTVHGSRLTPSANPNATLSGKTFVEETRTMIVFPQGAVLRLTESVAEGQILILKNPRVKQEVACRVVNSKTNAAAKGYVEVEFFQPTAGFWGITFPSGISTGQSEASATEEPAKQPQVAPVQAPAPAPIKAVYSKPPAAPPLPPVPASTPFSDVAPPSVPVPSQTLNLNRAIAAAYANGQAPSKKSEPAMDPVPDVAPQPPVAEAPRVEPAKTNNLSPSSKPFRSDKPKSDVKPQGVSKDAFVSSTPIVTADSIGHSETEFAGYSGPRGSVKQSSVAAAPISIETRKNDSAPESKSAELTFGRQLDSYQDKESDGSTQRSGRTWMLAGVAAAVVLLAGGGAYWWRHAKPSLASAKSAPAVSAPAAPDVSAGTNPQQPAGSGTNPQTAQNGSPQSQSSAAGQKSNLNSNSAVGTSASAPANKSGKPGAVASDRRQIILPSSKIIAPTTPTNGASKTSFEPAPDVTGRSAVPQSASLGSMISGIGQPSGSVPAPPPPSRSSGNVSGASVVQQPKLLQAVQPVYPKQALLRGDEGDVTIDALVDQYGKVVATKVLTGPITLREAAVAAVSQQRYQPAKLNGIPTSAHVMITMTFKKKN